MNRYSISFVMHGIARIEADSKEDAENIFEEMEEEELAGFVEMIESDGIEKDDYDEE